ncbi:hypothetical protein B0T22DRAFT_221162 [Podospora appendiculata]|uniref:F-box domain-containing protein n=1 Tax=Podospora appendiculata TaxID=314037 RepID=A0AAE0X5G3_9PEZI|nr:hypothetical protein B0T22DRAFT_221162 [Podospora appendiculata]
MGRAWVSIKMKFFKKKEKRRDDGGIGGKGEMPGFGPSTTDDDNGNQVQGNHRVFSNGTSSFSRATGYRAFGSPPPLEAHDSRGSQNNQFRPMATRASAQALANLPPAILERIFAFVCPHTLDESYETCEQSAIEDACMLCDLRDLAHCVAVSKRWRKAGVKQLYHSIRLDTVHYCEREVYLSERRKRRSFFDRNGEPEDTTQARLKLLSRSLREDPVRLGKTVQFLKTPYMLRNACQADLARTIAVTPNLRYVDLPEGLFTDDPSFVTLRLEVQARCHELRKMTYMAGSEHSLQALASGTIWPKLEVLELVRVNLDPTMLRQVLGSLGNLRALKISETECVGDETLAWNDMLPPFPPLEEFILNDVPNVTIEGLKGWLATPGALQALQVLTLNGTGVHVWTLHEVVAHVPGLKHLSIVDSVTAAMSAPGGPQNIPPLTSTSLETLHYEITAARASPRFTSVTTSYHNYLASSLLSGGLPNLHALYVRDPNFPELLLGLPPPAPGFAGGGIARPSSSGSNRAFSPHHGSNNNSFSSNYSPKSPQTFLSPAGSSPPFAPPHHLNPFAAPAAPFAGAGHRAQSSISSLNGPQQFSSNNPFASMLGPSGPASFSNLPAKLEVFTKGDDELDWSFVKVSPGMALPSARQGNTGRPMSSYGLGADVMGGSAAGWSSGSGARKSVFIGGAGAGGGFLAVPPEVSGGGGGGIRGRNVSTGSSVGGGLSPSESGGGDEWPRPVSSAGERRREKLDLWR